MLQLFRDAVRVAFFKLVVEAGREGTAQAVAALAAELSGGDHHAANGQPAQPLLVSPPPTIKPPAQLPAAGQPDPPAILPAPPITLSPTAAPEPRRGPGRPRKSPENGGAPSC